MIFQNIFTVICALLAAVCANCVPIIHASGWGTVWVFALMLIAVNLLPIASYNGPRSFMLRMCSHGVVCLKAFYIALPITVIVQIIFIHRYFPTDAWWAVGTSLTAVITLALLFWNGIICVYLFSTQLGIEHRLKGVIMGLIPVANLVMLYRIIKTVCGEIEFEKEKLSVNSKRKGENVCATVYPLLFVHGVCFRDFAFPNYWGRVPHELERNGAKVFYGNHGSAASICDSALELTARIKYITDDLGYGKVNIIAHSKGGLDCRYAIAEYGIGDRVASLVTINTPHKGCAYADYLLSKIPMKVQNKVANTYNSVLKRLGDDSPDFLAAMRDLTESRVLEITSSFGDEHGIDGICCISIGSKINSRSHAKMPMSLTHGFVKKHEGDNDGLVSTHSFEWSDDYRFIKNNSLRGISHADIIDMTRENIPGFDVREFYVELVSELKKKGL
ncbi:MAG: alpha/beta fold hydrolase [Clostridia bacterium]|nr:alpha/beta fold hydrolase [Clostridia bacterium]